MTRPTSYDLLAIDLDGTLLGTDHRVPERNLDALRRAHAAGMKIVLCTGRSFPETRGVLAQIDGLAEAVVSVFGAQINELPGGRTLERVLFPIDDAIAVATWFRERGYAVLWVTDRELAGFDGYLFDGPRRHEAYDRWLALSGCEIRTEPGPTRGHVAPTRISIIDDAGTLNDVSAELRAAFDGRLTHNVLEALPYDLTVIESFAPQVSKWYGIERLCRRWGIDPARTVAFGDAVNDVQMIEHAGLGVAMANAGPRAKAVADRVTATNDECGVALLIEELLGSSVRPPWRT